MDIVVIMAVRNEGAYIANCLDHLIKQGVQYFIIDNDSEDGSLEILRQPRYSNHLVGLKNYPFTGMFDWDGILKVIEDTCASLLADWVILSAPDEVLHPQTDETLLEAISRVDKEGFDAINFNEFVFLPIGNNYVVNHFKPQPMQWYYFHEPAPLRLVRGRRANIDATWRRSGGHQLEGNDLKIARESFVLRHYIFQSQEHAFRKYREREFRPEELRRGWHGNRFQQPWERFLFPQRDELEFLGDPSTHSLSVARPRTSHYWQWTERPHGT